MKTTTFNGFIAVALLAILALAPLQFASANTGNDNGGFFSNLREKQLANRQNVKANLLQILSSEESAEESVAIQGYTPASLATATYQLTDIADRIESRMIILKNQGTTLSQDAHTTLALARTKLEGVTLQLGTETVNTDAITTELASVRSDLQKIIAEIKTTLTK